MYALKSFTTESDWITASVDLITSVCKEKTHIALSGGKTPGAVYEVLAKRNDIPLDTVCFFQVDERYVPQTDENSNYKLINDSLIKPLGGKEKNFSYFDTSKPIEEALESYEAKLKEALPFDLTVLGLGTDGHTASLFKKGSALHETKKLVANTHTYEFSVYERLTLTFPAIMSSKKLMLLVSGKNKKEALDQLLHSDIPFEDFPAKKLLDHPDLSIHFGDY
jgi:6-phosphogluconolactonase